MGTGDLVAGATSPRGDERLPQAREGHPGGHSAETTANVTPTAARAPLARRRARSWRPAATRECRRTTSRGPGSGRSYRTLRGGAERVSVSARPRSPRGTSGGARGSASSFRVFRCSSSRQEKGSPAAVRVTGRGDETHREPLRRHVRTRESAHRRGKSHFRRGRARGVRWWPRSSDAVNTRPALLERRTALGDTLIDDSHLGAFFGKRFAYEYPVGGPRGDSPWKAG